MLSCKYQNKKINAVFSGSKEGEELSFEIKKLGEQKLLKCQFDQYSKNESSEHKRAKVVLFHWLKKQFPECEINLEYFHDKIKRRSESKPHHMHF